MELVRELVAGVAATRTLRASALNHKVRNNPVEDQSVVKRLAGFRAFREVHEILYRGGSFVVEQFDLEAAFARIEHRVHFSCHVPIVAASFR